MLVWYGVNILLCLLKIFLLYIKTTYSFCHPLDNYQTGSVVVAPQCQRVQVVSCTLIDVTEVVIAQQCSPTTKLLSLICSFVVRHRIQSSEMTIKIEHCIVLNVQYPLSLICICTQCISKNMTHFKLCSAVTELCSTYTCFTYLCDAINM